MKPFDGRKGKRLSHETVGDLRFFGFYIGNETILATTKWGVGYDIGIIFEPSEALGNVFALMLFRDYDSKANPQKVGQVIPTDRSSTQLIGEYIESLNDKTEFPFSFETLRSPNTHNWRDTVMRFFKDLGARKLETAPLVDMPREVEEDQADGIIDEGSYMERAAAVFCNVLRMDAEYNVINEDWARHRTSQYIRMIHDDDYKVLPPFKEWEMELWM